MPFTNPWGGNMKIKWITLAIFVVIVIISLVIVKVAYKPETEDVRGSQTQQITSNENKDNQIKSTIQSTQRGIRLSEPPDIEDFREVEFLVTKREVYLKGKQIHYYLSGNVVLGTESFILDIEVDRESYDRAAVRDKLNIQIFLSDVLGEFYVNLAKNN